MVSEIGKIIEFVSTSKTSFDDAVWNAVNEISKKEKNIRGVDILKMTAKINKHGKIEEYRVNVKISAEL